MKVRYSYQDEQLIKDVREDIFLFGKNHKVYAIYSLFDSDPTSELITDYVDEEPPTRDEADSEEEYQKLLSDYQKNIDSLKFTKHKSMTSFELLQILEEQAKIL